LLFAAPIPLGIAAISSSSSPQDDNEDDEPIQEIAWWLPSNDTVLCVPLLHQCVFPWFEFNETTIRLHSTVDGTRSVFYSLDEFNHSFYSIRISLLASKKDQMKHQNSFPRLPLQK
jgi:hypothetical protein